MPLSHEQLQELSLLQDKYNNENITKKQYEILKKEVLSEWEDIVRKPSGNIILAILILLWNLVRWIWRKWILVAKYIHKIFWKWSSRKNIPLWKIYAVFMSIVLIFMIGNVLYTNHTGSIKKAEVQAIQDKKNAEEKVLQDKKMADIKTEQERIEKEKAGTPKPSIEIQSSQVSQWKKTTYILKFTASGADTITVNGENLTINWSGIYEKEISLESIETAISLTAKNKYYSTESAFLITRDKNAEDIAREKKKQEDEEYQKRAQAIMEKREWAKTSYYAIAKTCEKRVLEVLISPKTAEFPSPSAENIHFNDDKIRYNGYVDSQNAYGALIRSNYRCDVERYIEDGEEYVRTSVELY